MNRLLKSDFYRLFKSKSYYICTAVALFLMALNIFLTDYIVKTAGKENPMYSTFPYKDGISFGISIFTDTNLLMITSIFIAIYITAEFSHGTMKNAVSKGFNKFQIYFSKLITMTVATFLAFVVNFIGAVISCTIITGTVGDLTGEYVAYIFRTIGIELLLSVALTSVLVMIAMVFRNLGGAIAVNIIGVFSFGTLIFTALEFLFDGKIKFTDFSLMKNIQFYAINQSPAGSDYLRSVIVGLVFLAITCAFGNFVFKKADVKQRIP